ncbi:MAG: CHAT domain-containing tetratricopeptide repeat protein [Blastocatellia bacterium]
MTLPAFQPLERALNGGDQHLYQITLAADDYLNLALSHRGIVVTARLIDTDGQPLVAWPGGTETTEATELAIIAPRAGSYRLVLQGTGAGAGAYTVEVKTRRPATAEDRQRATARRLTLDGAALVSQRTAASRREALVKFGEAVTLWRAIGDARPEFDTLRLLADLHFALAEYRQAMDRSGEMQALARRAGGPDLELIALKNIGVLHNSLSEYPAARRTLEQVLARSRETRDRLTERVALNSLGVAAAAMGERRLAIEYYQQALLIAREIQDRAGEATMLRNLGIRYEGIGEPILAMDHYQQALALRRQLGARDPIATTMLDLARMFRRQGDLQQALDLAGQALVILRDSGRQESIGLALEHLSVIHQDLRDFDRARDALDQALSLYRGAGIRRREAVCLRGLAALDVDSGETARARPLLEQALTVHRDMNAPTEIMLDLLYLGICDLAQDRPRQALTPLAEALALCRRMDNPPGETQVLLQSARARRALGEIAEAEAAAQQAMTISRTRDYRTLQALAGQELARLALRRGNDDEARTHIEAAIDIVENTRDSLIDPLMRAGYRGGKQTLYELFLETLLRRPEAARDPRLAAQALASVERARARTLLELLTESHIDIRQGVDTALLDTERSLRQRLSAKAELAQRPGAGGQAAQAKQLEAEINTLTTELHEAESRIRAASPAYAALTQPRPLTLSEIQRQVLDRHTLLLEYALGAERSFLFAVTDKTLHVYSLPGREAIEQAARAFHETLTRRGRIPVFSGVNDRQQWLQRLESETDAAAGTLARLILQPAAAEMAGKRLMIVPDGALHYVPFAALPDPAGTPPSAPDKAGQQNGSAGKSTMRHPRSGIPLIAGHEIVTLPSASTLALIRREHGGRQPAPDIIAVLADPVFAPDDERLAAVRAGAPAPVIAAMATDSRRAGNAVSFPRLPHTRVEAGAIRAAAPDAQSRIALDFAASRDTATSGALGRYRYVHFATHGILDQAHPDLSGLALSLFDAHGAPQNGFLRAMDVYNLKLNAELVTLSGCHTALGRDVRGEGLISLTRGFMYAGARRVLASLWQVNDAATAELMKSFYREMLGGGKQSPASALRAAQRKMLQHPRWRAPYYWAAFSLQGEW